MFTLDANSERFDFVPRITSMRFSGASFAGGHPAIEHADFIMAASIDGQHATRELDVGLWKTPGGYLVAAFMRLEDGFGAPIELVRSTRPIRSVTFFPSPDSNAGRLGLVEETGSGIALVCLDWNHDALSRIIRPRPSP